MEETTTTELSLAAIRHVAARVRPLTLKALMRHKSIETTLRYYVDQDADDVAAELWQD